MKHFMDQLIQIFSVFGNAASSFGWTFVTVCDKRFLLNGKKAWMYSWVSLLKYVGFVLMGEKQLPTKRHFLFLSRNNNAIT